MARCKSVAVVSGHGSWSSQRMVRISAWTAGISGLAKTFHTPKSVRLVPSDGIERKRSLAVGFASVAGRSLEVLAASVGIGRLKNDAGPTWLGKVSYSFWVVPVLC